MIRNTVTRFFMGNAKFVWEIESTRASEGQGPQ